MYFLRRAYELFTLPPEKMLSPSFESVHGGSGLPLGFDSILPSIEHALGMLKTTCIVDYVNLFLIGRLKYTTGDTEGAVRFFMGLLKGSIMVDGVPEGGDKVYLDDFRVAFEVNPPIALQFQKLLTF